MPMEIFFDTANFIRLSMFSYNLFIQIQLKIWFVGTAIQISVRLTQFYNNLWYSGMALLNSRQFVLNSILQLLHTRFTLCKNFGIR